jgi:MinD superfamily P-loop ATPase
MKEITIVSGKGGTGKTSVAAALASVAKNVVFCDNDVDAADLHLIFHPEIKETYRFSSGSKAVIFPDKCTDCGLCEEYCRFGAIQFDKTGIREVNPFLCEGCRVCERVCPEQAITVIESNNNFWYVSETRFGTLVHAKMGPGEENSGKLVTEVRRKAKEIAIETNADYVINDGPPGIGCAAIASITGADLVLMVIEPTLSGLHDAKRMIELVTTFKAPVFAIINKFDINPDITSAVECYLAENQIALIGKLPFAAEMVQSMVKGKTVVEFDPDQKISREFFYVWESIENNLR